MASLTLGLKAGGGAIYKPHELMFLWGYWMDRNLQSVKRVFNEKNEGRKKGIDMFYSREILGNLK